MMRWKNLLGCKTKTLLVGLFLFVISFILVGLLLLIPTLRGLYETLESYLYFQLFIPTTTPSKHLLVVDEEDKSFDRADYARLITGLNRLGAKVIVLDVLFAEKIDSIKDAQLIAATSAAKDKVIHAIEFVDRERHVTIPERFQLKTLMTPAANCYIQNVRGAVLPMDGLLRATRHLGGVSGSTDIAHRDDQYFPMIFYYNEQLYPSLPLMAVMKFLDVPVDSMTFPACIEDEIVFKKKSITYPIPLDSRCQTLINFISPDAFSTKHIPLTKAFEYIEKNDSLFTGKIVLIGNSVDSQERIPGPRLQNYPTLYMYATLISQILNRETIKEGILESLGISLILLVGSILALIFLSRRIPHIKRWDFYLIALGVMVLAAIIGLYMGVKLYVILPFLVFCFAYELTKRFYEYCRKPNGKQKILLLDFYLAIGPKREKRDTYPLTLIASPAGEDSCEIRLSLKERDINKIREEMAQNFQLDIKKLKDFGAHLFRTIFHPDIHDQYHQSVGMAYSQNTCLRIRLRIDAPDLAYFPWEFMYDGDQTHEFLALHQNISITRFISIQNPVPAIATSLPLRMLVIISSPAHPDYPKLEVEKEKKSIKQALKQLVKRDLIRIRFLEKATLAALEKELRRKVDIIHFIGHGGYCEPLGGGCLVFESPLGGQELINIDRLSLLLRGTPVRLIVLNACRTAQVASSEISLSVAEGLVKIGVPAVIAMQFPIPDSSALNFASAFYETLAETYQVDRAVAEARRQMFINLEGGRIDWGIPVLIMRKDDGVIF
ncbi:MAG: CHAT domain-containing protein [candidate division KSB1 bacterium]|nr:CHAT domain-containing protein [candidate division KSB1 bacterium]MDZ7318351.1 CHAT domain-containing protein [candidate division KSB1 bacterium]MDZ7340686.1 CHAT domain-containing protein [candidate division KSB1 bacterium]